MISISQGCRALPVSSLKAAMSVQPIGSTPKPFDPRRPDRR